MDDLKNALMEGFSRGRLIEVDDYTHKEKERAKELVQERFNNDMWTFRL